MIKIKNKLSIQKMEEAGSLLVEIFEELQGMIKPGITTLEIDDLIAKKLKASDLVSKSKGYMGYQHSSCISVNDVVVHGIPSSNVVLRDGDLVKVDVCASYKGYCADMARSWFIGEADAKMRKLVEVTQRALDKGIAMARPGNRLSDISAAIQLETEAHGFGVVRDFAGHGIGKAMHEDPEILNYGKPGEGPILRPGMTFAIEPMITAGNYEVFVEQDGWTVKTKDKSWAAHIEDTIAITENGPKILTRKI
jgi:methionyl aminopeptidase